LFQVLVPYFRPKHAYKTVRRGGLVMCRGLRHSQNASWSNARSHPVQHLITSWHQVPRLLAPHSLY